MDSAQQTPRPEHPHLTEKFSLSRHCHAAVFHNCSPLQRRLRGVCSAGVNTNNFARTADPECGGYEQTPFHGCIMPFLESDGLAGDHVIADLGRACCKAHAEFQIMASALSTVHRGVAFERRSLEVLQNQLSMSLCKVGGKSDGGVDLQGWWWIPPSTRRSAVHPPPVLSTGTNGETRQRFRVLGQCKAEAKKMGPNYVREMEGVLHRHHVAVAEVPVVALLVSQSAFTRTTILRAFSSPIPFFLLHLPLPLENLSQRTEEEDDHLGAAIWNPALAGEDGLLGGEMEVRWERSLSRDGGRPGLWWKGQRLKGWIPESEELDL